MRLMGLAAALALAGCATVPAERGPVEVQLIALNDFHGNLEPPKSAIDYPGPGPNAVQVPAGGGRIPQARAHAQRNRGRGRPNADRDHRKSPGSTGQFHGAPRTSFLRRA